MSAQRILELTAAELVAATEGALSSELCTGQHLCRSGLVLKAWSESGMAGCSWVDHRWQILLVTRRDHAVQQMARQSSEDTKFCYT